MCAVRLRGGGDPDPDEVEVDVDVETDEEPPPPDADERPPPADEAVDSTTAALAAGAEVASESPADHGGGDPGPSSSDAPYPTPPAFLSLARTSPAAPAPEPPAAPATAPALPARYEPMELTQDAAELLRLNTIAELLEYAFDLYERAPRHTTPNIYTKRGNLKENRSATVHQFALREMEPGRVRARSRDVARAQDILTIVTERYGIAALIRAMVVEIMRRGNPVTIAHTSTSEHKHSTSEPQHTPDVHAPPHRTPRPDTIVSGASPAHAHDHAHAHQHAQQHQSALVEPARQPLAPRHTARARTHTPAKRQPSHRPRSAEPRRAPASARATAPAGEPSEPNRRAHGAAASRRGSSAHSPSATATGALRATRRNGGGSATTASAAHPSTSPAANEPDALAPPASCAQPSSDTAPDSAADCALVVFAGPGERPDGLAAYLRSFGWRVVEVDILIGAEAHDVTSHVVAATLITRTANGEFAAVFLAPPCSSYSVAHRPKLRSAAQPEGITPIPSEWTAYLAKHNAITAAAFDIVEAALMAGADVLVENPADRGYVDGPAFWHQHRDHGSLWRTARARAAGLTHLTFAQCAFGAVWQKWTTIAASPSMIECTATLAERGCAHGTGRHAQQARGVDSSGASRASQAAAYPAMLNAFIAIAFEAARAMRRAKGRQPPRARPDDDPPTRVCVDLAPIVAQAVLAARHAPPRFASEANRHPAASAAVRAAPFPNRITGVMVTSASRRALKKGRPLPPAPPIPASPSTPQLWPGGDVPVAALFLPGVYAEYVVAWMAKAARAARDLIAGRRPPKVETVVLPQLALQPFARGVVWDCTQPRRCEPVRRSDRSTVFPGQRQIDRAAIRRMASELDWEDDDIVRQIGEGGIEARSDCALTVVLSWHHTGLIANLAAAHGVITGEMEAEWVSQPTSDLPYVPCRVLPRNVIMQQRTRRLPDGSYEPYLKPRVSTDCSDGAADSVNGGVPPEERDIELPTVQQYGRAVATVDAAGTTASDEAAGETPTRAEMYIVDATAAYRFCPLNIADLYTQIFVYWVREADGRLRIGFCVDRRLMFGGSYAPNRFERISRLVGAYIQRQQRAFDSLQPPPPCAARWARMRRGRQRAGLLRDALEESEPRSLQVFIDDWMGAALNDPVALGPELQRVSIEPAATRSIGGEPSAPHSRARAHACIAMAELRSAGLEPAEDKTLLGDPVVALGIRVSRKRRRLDIPPTKGDAILAEIAVASALADEQPPIARRDAAEQLTGRLCHVSQVSPEIAPALQAGYALAHAPAARHAGATVRMRAGSATHAAWRHMLDAATAAIQRNQGVCLAPRRAFPSPDSLGTATAFSDASGDDGVGGYATVPDQPGHVWVVSEVWPPDILAALQRAARGERGPAALAMPAAELFGMWAIPAAARAHGMPARRVIAIGDCQPAVLRLRSPHGGAAQMRTLAAAAHGDISDWLPVHVRRTFNTVSDDLSHPDRATRVIAAMEASGLTVTRCHIYNAPRCWAALLSAAAAGTAATPRAEPSATTH